MTQDTESGMLGLCLLLVLLYSPSCYAQHQRRALGDPLLDRIRELQLLIHRDQDDSLSHILHRPRHHKRGRDGLIVTANLHSTQSDMPLHHRRKHHRSRDHIPSYNFMTMAADSKSCPRMDGKDRIQCPTSSNNLYHVCIFKSKLCDDVPDCPNGEDEDKTNCLFYRTTLGHFKQVVDTVVDLTDHLLRSRKRHHEL